MPGLHKSRGIRIRNMTLLQFFEGFYGIYRIHCSQLIFTIVFVLPQVPKPFRPKRIPLKLLESYFQRRVYSLLFYHEIMQQLNCASR